MLTEALTDQLIAAARQAREQAYCPYSGFAVGAAVLDAAGRIHTGCNVENASYGLSICAERAAVFAAVAGGIRRAELVAVALVGGPLAEASATWQEAPTPCGACRQVLSEFAAHDCVVLCAPAGGGITGRFSLSQLLPHAFNL